MDVAPENFCGAFVSDTFLFAPSAHLFNLGIGLLGFGVGFAAAMACF